MIPRLLYYGCAALLVAMAAGTLWGSSSIDASSVFAALFRDGDVATRAVLLDVRLPRVIMAANTGAVLALGGLCFQNVLRNPLAEPYILGVSGGAAVGGILGILLGWSAFGNHLAAFCGGLLILILVMKMASPYRGEVGLLLSGVMLNAFCGAVILFLIALAKPYEIGIIMFWFMGNLGGVSLTKALWYTAALLPGVCFLVLSSHAMNVLLLGRDAAVTLGLPAERVMYLLLAVTSLMVSALVAVVGPLGFVGLVVPQALRLLVGSDNRVLAPGCVFFGATFVILCDLLARALPPEGELPVGVITALIGAPVFIVLQRKAGEV